MYYIVYLVMFNYICAKCMEKCINPLCNYAHSDNEIFFHPLVFKTHLCRKYLTGNCGKELCPLSHDCLNDFRIIYSTTDENIKKVIEMSKILYDTSTYCSKNLSLPLEFNKYTYKVSQCPMTTYCKLDRPLCLNYHTEFERRRCPKAFNYGPLQCNNIFKDHMWGNPTTCQEVYYINIGR
jgi:hypothetical protein